MDARKATPCQDPIMARKPKDRFLRFVSQRHARRYHLGGLSELKRTVFPHTIVTADRRLLYIKNSKAGCSTVASLFYQYDNGHLYNGNIHHAPIGHFTESWQRWEDIPSSSVSFSTVRNPQHRSVSAFFNFFIDQKNAEASKHQDIIETFGFSDKADKHYRFDVFLEYVEASFEQSVRRTDRHFRPQHVNLGHGEIELAYVGHIETLDTDLKHISEKAGVSLLDPSKLPKKMRNQSTATEFVPSLSQRRKVESLYKEDYEIYGY